MRRPRERFDDLRGEQLPAGAAEAGVVDWEPPSLWQLLRGRGARLQRGLPHVRFDGSIGHLVVCGCGNALATISRARVSQPSQALCARFLWACRRPPDGQWPVLGRRVALPTLLEALCPGAWVLRGPEGSALGALFPAAFSAEEPTATVVDCPWWPRVRVDVRAVVDGLPGEFSESEGALTVQLTAVRDTGALARAVALLWQAVCAAAAPLLLAAYVLAVLRCWAPRDWAFERSRPQELAGVRGLDGAGFNVFAAEALRAQMPREAAIVEPDDGLPAAPLPHLRYNAELATVEPCGCAKRPQLWASGPVLGRGARMLLGPLVPFCAPPPFHARNTRLRVPDCGGSVPAAMAAVGAWRPSRWSGVVDRALRARVEHKEPESMGAGFVVVELRRKVPMEYGSGALCWSSTEGAQWGRWLAWARSWVRSARKTARRVRRASVVLSGAVAEESSSAREAGVAVVFS